MAMIPPYKSAAMTASLFKRSRSARSGAALDQASVEHQLPESDNKRVLVRFADVESQIKASEAIGEILDDTYVVALTLAPRTPAWLRTLRFKPMSLGLDLRGGVHFVFEVDLQTGINQYLERYAKDLQDQLREARISRTVELRDGVIRVEIADAEDRDTAERIVNSVNNIDETIAVSETSVGGRPVFNLELTPAPDQRPPRFCDPAEYCDPASSR